MVEKLKGLLKKWWLLGGIIVIIIIILINLISKPKFEITDFSITKETEEYEYIDNSVYYDGEGLITTKDKKSIYVVALKVKRISGGMIDSEEEYTTTVIVTNGKGNFGTYDYGSESEIKKPKYEFEILGYVKFKK